MVGPERVISSRPSLPCTTSACSAPMSCNTFAWIPTSSEWKTPITILGALAGLVSGPRILKMVRTPRSLRIGTTFFIAGWWLGANIKPTPSVLMHCPTAAEVRLSFTPRASSTSALPDLLLTLRLPCFAILAPAAAATNIDAVEILKVCAPSPPVPTTSTKWVLSSTSTGVAKSRITCAAAAISVGLSFLLRKATNSAATIGPGSSPPMIARMMPIISSLGSSLPSIKCCRAADAVIVMRIWLFQL